MTLMVLIQLPARAFVLQALIPVCVFLLSWTLRGLAIELCLQHFRTFPAQGSEPFGIPPAQFQKPVNDTAVIPLLTQVSVLNFISCCFSKYSNNSNKKRKDLFDPLLQVQAAALHCWEVKVAGSQCGKSQPWSDAQFIQFTISCLVNGATHSEQFPSSIKIIKMIPHRSVPRLIWSR